MKTIQEGNVKYDRPAGVCTWRDYRNWSLFVNKGWRDAEVLAISGYTFLFEYEMLNGKFYWQEVALGEDGKFNVYSARSVSQTKTPVKWLDALLGEGYNVYLVNKNRQSIWGFFCSGLR